MQIKELLNSHDICVYDDNNSTTIMFAHTTFGVASGSDSCIPSPQMALIVRSRF